MNQRNQTKFEGSGLFSDVFPMKKSYILSETFTNKELDISTSTIVLVSQRKKTQLLQTSRRSAVINSISYPGASFLIKKIKRIVQFQMSKIFKKIKIHKKVIINLDLINKIQYRLTSSAFFNIKIYSQSRKGTKLSAVISRNKKPHFLFQTIARCATSKYKEAFSQILIANKRKMNIQKFLTIIQYIVQTEIKNYCKRLFLKKLKNVVVNKNYKKIGTKNLTQWLLKVILKRKQEAISKISSYIHISQLQNAYSTKKQMTSKMSETVVQKAKSMALQRQKIKEIKNNLDDFSYDKSKSRYQIRRDLNVQRNKLKEQQKRVKAITAELVKCNDNLQMELQKLVARNYRREERKKKNIRQETVNNLYKVHYIQQPNKLGQIKLKIVRLDTCQKQIKQTDQFYLYENQKLRQEIFEYQGLLAGKNYEPRAQTIVKQNQILKQMFKNIIGRNLDKLVNLSTLNQVEF